MAKKASKLSVKKKPKDIYHQQSLGTGVSFQFAGKYPTVVAFKKKFNTNGSPIVDHQVLSERQIGCTFTDADACIEISRWFKKAATFLKSNSSD